MIGARFERLVVIEPLEKKYGKWVVKVKCDCGTEKAVYLYDMQRGKVKSCGCLNQELRKQRATTHGMKGTKIYNTWKNIRNRCLNKNNKQYDDYGGRGIKICERWESFENFYKDMGDVPEGMTIDRIDNSKGYTPENCRWATRQQNRNRRLRKKNKLGIEGVYFDKATGKYRAYINRGGKMKHLYYGPDFFEACCARKSAENLYSGA